MGIKQKLFSVTIEDCKVSTFSVGGAGGSGKDTSNTGVYIVHPPSGASGRATETRSQRTNKERAFKRMAESKQFQSWARLKASELSTGQSIDEWVEQQLEPRHLKVEYKTAEGWKLETNIDNRLGLRMEKN